MIGPMQLGGIQARSVVAMLTSNWLLLIGLLAVGLVAFWTFQERDARGSTVQGVGERADDFFGNLLGGFGSLLLVTLTILTTIGANLVNLTEVLVMIAGNGPPLLLVNIATAIVGFLGLAGIVDVSAVAWGIIVLALLLIGLGVRQRRGRGSFT